MSETSTELEGTLFRVKRRKNDGGEYHSLYVARNLRGLLDDVRFGADDDFMSITNCKLVTVYPDTMNNTRVIQPGDED